jgi:hypothetical protein
MRIKNKFLFTLESVKGIQNVLEKELERQRNWKRNGYGMNKKTNMVSQLDNVSCPQGKWNGKQKTMERSQNL